MQKNNKSRLNGLSNLVLNSSMIKQFLLIVPFFLFGQSVSITSKLIADGFKKPIFVTSHPKDANMLYVVEQAGSIKIINNGKVVDRPFLNIDEQVVNPSRPGDERGLLGFAFHPEHARNGKFYVNYMNNDGYTIVSEFSVLSKKSADQSTERILFELEQPYRNHNGGHMQFGPDGYLYISIGDGGKAGDPLNAGQDLNTLLGKVIRIDVDVQPYGIPKSNPYYGQENKRGEVWAWGFRNVWRFSFDRKTGDIYYGDVGQNKWEEVNYEPSDSPGGVNYGWRLMEASHCYNPEKDCPQDGLTMPIIEYPNDANYMMVLGGGSQADAEGCSVTGGYVYRGSEINGLQGYYLFGDYCSGNIWSFKVVDGKAVNYTNRTEEINLANGEFTTYISSFGEDANGELYIVEYNGGIYKIMPGN